MRKVKKYLKIWWIMSRNSFSMVISQKLSLSFFLTGKVFRFVLFFAFLYFLLVGAKSLAGYNTNQVLFFYLVFNVIEVISQFLFREVYRFRPLIVNGDFDYVLVKPMSALFRSLMGGADVIDLITIPPLVVLTIIIGAKLGPTFSETILFFALLINGFIIATSFYIMVLALAILTTEIDHTVMIFRDLTSLGRLPIDIYQQPLRGFLTYFIPVGIMMTLPVKAMIGLVSPGGVVVAFLVGIVVISIALRFWRYALTKYTSASS